MGNTRDVVGAFMYPKTMGPQARSTRPAAPACGDSAPRARAPHAAAARRWQLELFYLSCMRGWERKGRATARGLPHEVGRRPAEQAAGDVGTHH